MYPNVIYIHIFGYPSFPPHVSTSNKVTLIPVQSELERGCEVQRSLVELCVPDAAFLDASGIASLSRSKQMEPVGMKD